MRHLIVQPDFLFSLYEQGDLIYDIETYPNAFTVGIIHSTTRQRWLFEISFRRNDLILFCRFIERANLIGCSMVGYNNIGFDYPVIHAVYNGRMSGISVAEIYNKAMSIINNHGNRFAHNVAEWNWIIDQVDLYKIHHFDNPSKAVSLKVLEFNMRMASVEDLPFPVGTMLDEDQLDMLISYMWHDIEATLLFYQRSEPALNSRRKLSTEFDKNMMNMSDVKIGETILMKKMVDAGIETHYYDHNNRKQKKQTPRDNIPLADVMLPYLKFETPEFQKVYQFLHSKVIRETKGAFTDLHAYVDGLKYKFGTGGIHASVERTLFESDFLYQIVDVDVASFYPNLGIVNKFYPEHLGVQFCDAYLDVYRTRKTYPKGTPENEAFKLALNGSYGGSNNEYSPFYDPKYTMSITINGQLSLAMLVEWMLQIEGLTMIQANTDGITFLCPIHHMETQRQICKRWEAMTGLELEEALYSRMFVRDVNSYIAEKVDGKVKRIGAYAHQTAEQNLGTRELPYHKDWSMRVVALAAEANMIHGTDIEEFIRSHPDYYDFLKRTKVPKSSVLEWGGEQVENTVRYYISADGKDLEKVMPSKGPEGAFKRATKLSDFEYNQVIDELIEDYVTGGNCDAAEFMAYSREDQIKCLPWDERINTKNKSVYEIRRSNLEAGYKVQLCNKIPEHILNPQEPCDIQDAEDFFNDIDYDYYIREAVKLTEGFKRHG